MNTNTIEQAGCEWCTGEVLFKKKLEDGSVLRAYVGEDGVMGFYRSGEKFSKDIGYVEINFCPMCGRPFTLRPMTLEEAVAYGRPVYREMKVFGLADGSAWILIDELTRHKKHPETWRWMHFWPDKPTPEQSAAFPWKEECV